MLVLQVILLMGNDLKSTIIDAINIVRLESLLYYINLCSLKNCLSKKFESSANQNISKEIKIVIGLVIGYSAVQIFSKVQNLNAQIVHIKMVKC